MTEPTKVGSVLGPGSVVYSGEKVLLGDVQSDAELFLMTGETELWRGPFLNGDPPDELTEAARALLLTRLEGMTAELLEIDPTEAERLAALLLKAEPYETRLLALLLRAHDAAGHPRLAGAAYRRARAILAEVGEELPEHWPDFLAAQAGQAPHLVALSGSPASGTVSAARQARAWQVHRSTVLRWRRGEVQRPGKRGRAPRLGETEVAQVRRVIQHPREDGRRWTLAMIADYVDNHYGVRLSRSQLSRLLA